jgi:hypothetical protein
VGTRTQEFFGVVALCSCNLLFETNNFGLAAVLLSCIVSELQELPSPGIELRTLFRIFDPTVFSSWSQGISVPSLVQSEDELQYNVMKLNQVLQSYDVKTDREDERKGNGRETNTS